LAKNSQCQRVPGFAAVELELDRAAHRLVGDVAQDEDRLARTSQGGERLRDPVGGRSVNKALQDDVRGRRPVPQRRRDAYELVPLLGDERHIHHAAEQGFQHAMVHIPVQLVEVLVRQVAVSCAALFSCGFSLWRRGVRATPVRFIGLQTRSSGLRSGA